MVSKKGVWQVVVLIVALLATAGFVYAAEHPSEHPSEKMQVEHPAKKMGEMEKAKLTKEELAKAIRAYVEKEAALKGGYFLVYDKMAEKPLVLSLKKVHEDRLATIGDGVYFACADFETPDGKLYDLDIFMKGHDKDELKVKKIKIHKEEGKERYTWFEEQGMWKTKPAPGMEKHMMHEKMEGTMHKEMKEMEGTMHKGMEGTESK